MDDVKYFSPEAQVPFCGHATVAAAVALADRQRPGDVVSTSARARSLFAEAPPQTVRSPRHLQASARTGRQGDGAAAIGVRALTHEGDKPLVPVSEGGNHPVGTMSSLHL